MSAGNVTLTIAGRSYTIACGPGEEAHIAALGQSIDTKLAALNNLTGQSPERVLLYAALLLADELHEAKSGLSQVDDGADERAEALENLAERMEALASQLETGASTT